ncbi:MAG TPA: carbamoyltransferase HypF [Gemmatimonadales bacterium]|nr:carbamoyltransferase HypF [Gemmatimonadales bacterium]
MAAECSGLGARTVRVAGVVQGVGFRPFVFRLARAHRLTGWVLNDPDGVRIHVEGEEAALDAFLRQLTAETPPAARIDRLESRTTELEACRRFEIRESEARAVPTARISPDLPVCAACLAELSDPADRRFGYAYINCTDCGPRYSILLGLPYDRPLTTMREWPLCADCEREYRDPADRRFHAEPVACPTCGPTHALLLPSQTIQGDGRLERTEGDEAAIARAAELLRQGRILAIKGIGGYHLACDARCGAAVADLRERKYRKEKPFAVLVRDVETARGLVTLSPEAGALLTGPARPIVLARARVSLPGVAPECSELGVMLAYSPLHHLLFAHGAPDALVLTSGNRSSEPIAYRDDDARERLSGIADGFLVGARPIARRVDDSVVRAGAAGQVVLRRGRGLAPGTVARLPLDGAVLALGADLKNTVTLVMDGEALMSQHIGDLDHYPAFQAFEETIRDLTAMYRVRWNELAVVRDLHPEYVSSRWAERVPARSVTAVQHHRAHVASVLAERAAADARVIGVAYDGTGYGDDGAIWGGELFVGSVRAGFERTVHLRTAALPGGDAAARYPVQAAAGFLAQLPDLADLTAAPFEFPRRYLWARRLVESGVRSFPTTSVGRLFDAVAALLGFTREISFEGQAAVWLENLARGSGPVETYPFPVVGCELDFRPALHAVISDRLSGRPPAEIARAFHGSLARATTDAIHSLREVRGIEAVVLSGGVFQNELLLGEVLAASELPVWTNSAVPPNDGGVSLGQAMMLVGGAVTAASHPERRESP